MGKPASLIPHPHATKHGADMTWWIASVREMRHQRVVTDQTDTPEGSPFAKIGGSYGGFGPRISSFSAVRERPL